MHSVVADKELYSATLNNFLGTEPVILRNLGKQHYSMKSEYLPAWLNGKSPKKAIRNSDVAMMGTENKGGNG